MRVRSLRIKVLALLAFLGVAVFFVVLNLYMARLQAISADLRFHLETTERNFLELVVEEAALLSVPAAAEAVGPGYEEIAQGLRSHTQELGTQAMARSRLFTELTRTTRSSPDLYP